jgi:hypothetical protein
MAAAACGSDSSGSDGNDPNAGGQTGEETVGCLPVETTNLAWSERSSLGFSADELLNSLGAERRTRLTWDDGTSTSLTMTLARASGAPSFQQREWTDDGSGRELAAGPDCNDVVTVPATLTFTTNDGVFAEQWPVTLLADAAGSATGFVQLDLDAVGGSFDVETIDAAEYDDVDVYVNLSFDGDAWTGTVSGQGTRAQGDTVSATGIDIASF